MPQADQGVDRDRYTFIPRTAVFVRRGDEYLLIKGAPTKRLWAGRYNGLGGHVERDEGVLAAARRELIEEAGLSADLWLCGTLVIDAHNPATGICVFIFCGEDVQGELRSSSEGAVEWVRWDLVDRLPVVEDLPVLLSRIHAMRRGDPPFSARSFYEAGQLKVVFEK